MPDAGRTAPAESEVTTAANTAAGSAVPPSKVRDAPRSKGQASPSIFALSDVGKVRAHNEDSFMVARLERTLNICSGNSASPESRANQSHPLPESVHQGHILMVADGMGGHSAGEVASAMTIEALASYAIESMPWNRPRSRAESRALAEGLREAVKTCQAQVREAQLTVDGQRGMGTTLTLAYITWPDLFVVHVGDSRMYAMREGQLHQVTHDHTLAQQLVDSKVISPEAAEDSDFSNILVNALGGDTDDLKVELHHAQLFSGDVLLLCSDGLNKHVSDQMIAEELSRLTEGAEVEEVARTLVQAASDEGGTDNITAIVAKF